MDAPNTLHRSLLSTNAIENSFRNTRRKMGRVARIRTETDQATRWPTYIAWHRWCSWWCSFGVWCLLVHNANWDCSKFLELRGKFLEGKLTEKADIDRYNELLKKVKNSFRSELGEDAIKKLTDAAPDKLLGDDHLHHILIKLGRSKYNSRILELQKKLWGEHEIDPFMSSDIFVWYGSRGVHSDAAMLHMIEKLEALYRKNPDKDEVLKMLRQLGEWAQKGGVLNQ